MNELFFKSAILYTPLLAIKDWNGKHIGVKTHKYYKNAI